MNKAIARTCLVLLSVCACSGPVADKIDEARAIELARPHVTFEPESVEAEKATEGGRPVWQVTFCGAAERPPLGNFMIVTIDRQTGEVVALAKSSASLLTPSAQALFQVPATAPQTQNPATPLGQAAASPSM